MDKKLAACIQVFPIKSHYIWKDKIVMDSEFQLQIKCKENDYSDIEKCIFDNHSYEVPEIISIPIIKGNNAYLNWINQVTK